MYVNVYVVLLVIGYLAVGAVFARFMAISPMAVAVLLLAWPVFIVLLLLAPLINYYVNREFRD